MTDTYYLLNLLYFPKLSSKLVVGKGRMISTQGYLRTVSFV